MSGISLGRLGRVDYGSSYGVTTPFTGNNTLTDAQSGLWATNVGSSTAVTLTAPASPTIGTTYTLERAANFAFRFDPAGSHVVNGGGTGKYVELTGPGVMTFEYVRTGEWIITRDACNWDWEL